jgi:hypothetical protein
LMALQSELMEVRHVLTNVGGNLDDVAPDANSTGELHTSTGGVQGLVVRVESGGRPCRSAGGCDPWPSRAYAPIPGCAVHDRRIRLDGHAGRADRRWRGPGIGVRT